MRYPFPKGLPLVAFDVGEQSRQTVVTGKILLLAFGVPGARLSDGASGKMVRSPLKPSPQEIIWLCIKLERYFYKSL
jgi:hypothetical protein